MWRNQNDDYKSDKIDWGTYTQKLYIIMKTPSSHANPLLPIRHQAIIRTGDSRVSRQKGPICHA